MRRVSLALLLLALLVPAGAGPARAADSTGSVPGSDPAAAFREGNRLYQAGDFAAAARAYRSILDRGLTAPALEYNLGNAYLKAGDLGPAILHYRRALRLKPTYESAQKNLNYARSLTQDVKPEESAAGRRWAWLSRLRLGPGVAAFLVFLTVTAFFIVAALRLRRWRQRTGALVLQAALLGLALLFSAALLFEWTQIGGREDGVVTTPAVEVRTGPGDQYTVSFRLHQGTEVEVLREAAGWREIKVSDRLQGWAPETAVAVL